MANRDKALQTLEATVTRRVRASEALLKRMGVSEDAYMTMALNALIYIPELADCTPASMDVALIQALQCGLLPNQWEAVIVPFKSTATFIPMIAGRAKMAREATRGLRIHTQTVYRDDAWEYSEGLEPVLEHKPSPDGSRADRDVLAAYAWAHVPGAPGKEYEVLLRADIDRYRAMSRPRTARRGPTTTASRRKRPRWGRC